MPVKADMHHPYKSHRQTTQTKPEKTMQANKMQTSNMQANSQQIAMKKPLINAQTLHYFNAISAITSFHLFAKASANDEIIDWHDDQPEGEAGQSLALDFTWHVCKRMQQLSITEEEISLLVKVGVKRYHRGTCSYSLTPRICQQLLEDEEVSVQALDKLKNKYVVLGDEGRVIVTAGYRTTRFKNKRNKRVKRHRAREDRWLTSL
jgi:hypothetical protein